MPYSIKISADNIYNAMQQKAMKDTILAPTIGESIEMWMEQLC